MLSTSSFLHARGLPHYLKREACPGRFPRAQARTLCCRLAAKKDRPEEGAEQDGGDVPEGKVDIDVLAQKLSEMAGKLREQEKMQEQLVEEEDLVEEQEELLGGLSGKMEGEGLGEVWEEESARFKSQVWGLSVGLSGLQNGW